MRDEMLTLAKSAQLDTDITPNLGTMLLFHLMCQAHQHHGPITCGGVITVLANSLGVDLSSLAQLTGERVVGTTTFRAISMITQQQGRTFIRIPGVAELFPTPMPNLFSIEDGVLHFVEWEEEEEVGPEGEHLEEPDVEEEDPEEEAHVPPQYTTYKDLHDLGDHINDISNLATNLRNTSFDFANNFYSWGDAMFPRNFQPPP